MIFNENGEILNGNLSSQVQQDKEYLIYCLNSENKEGAFNYIYPMTTENIRGYLSFIKNFSKVLCVASSGDHLLNCVAKGSKEITIFDINPITYYLNYLKIGALNLDRDTFIRFFTVDKDWETYSKDFFSYQIYINIRKYLSNDIAKFWDIFYDELKKRNVTPQSSKLFRYMRHSRETIVDANLYLDIEYFSKMKDLIKEVKINFILSDIKDLESMDNTDKFNTILLSNISDYISDIWGYSSNESDNIILDIYSKFVDRLLKKYADSDCRIFYAYIYQAITGPKWTPIDKIALLHKYFKPLNRKSIPAFSRMYYNDNSLIDYILYKDSK